MPEVIVQINELKRNLKIDKNRGLRKIMKIESD